MVSVINNAHSSDSALMARPRWICGGPGNDNLDVATSTARPSRAAWDVEWPTWAIWKAERPTQARESTDNARWIEVDNALRGIARRRAALDADEARWLREAQALKIWRPLGMTNAQDYLERILGYGPKAAQDRLRVANALGELPALEEALSTGELSFSAVRELTRVATPDTDAAWTTAAKGKNLRQIETLVTGRRSGDLPDDPPDPEVRTHVVRFELSPETFAAMRQARAIIEAEHRTNLTDDDFMTVVANMVIEGAADFPSGSNGSPDDAYPHPDADLPMSSESEGEWSCFTGNDNLIAADVVAVTDMGDGQSRAETVPPMTRGKYQVSVMLCGRCKQGWQLGAGAKIAIGPEAVERAVCDAQHIGSIDAAIPQRAYQDISPAVARLVWQRDEGRCRTPGCRSSRALEIHHVIPRAEGGGHEPSNLRLTCSACHKAQHDGRLLITAGGDRIDARTAELAATRSVETSHQTEARDAKPAIHHRAIDIAVMRAQARDALVGLGWKAAISRAAVDAAMAELGDGSLEALIREALRRCPKM